MINYMPEYQKKLIDQSWRSTPQQFAPYFEGFREQLAGRENTVFKLYPGLNHCFVDAIYDDILKASKEYGTERHIGDEVIGDIAAFILDGNAQ